MRVAVSTIMRNESQHLDRWAASARDADVLCLADTGSTDSSVEHALDLGIRVEEISVVPFRFDLARNAGLALLPLDVDLVITVDCDEVLAPGWRDSLEAAFDARPDVWRFSYWYVWSWVEPGVPDVAFTADRCHTRTGWRWHGAVHEVLVPSATLPGPALTAPAGFTIEHHADPAKSRSSYRDAVVDLVELYLAQERFVEAQGMAARALRTTERPGDYMSTAKVWDDEWLQRVVGGVVVS